MFDKTDEGTSESESDEIFLCDKSVSKNKKNSSNTINNKNANYGINVVPVKKISFNIN